jgi:peptidoglycan/xylan/chitin deacetylase (PgdA/CDA1 family)
VEKPVAAQPANKEQVVSTVPNKPAESIAVPIKEDAVNVGKITLEQPMPILMYHKVSKKKAERFRMPMERFEEQLKYLQSNGFQTITVSELLKGTVPDNAVIITFDDVGLTFYERVYPLLKKYNMKATAFVIVGDLRSDGKGFTWKILKEMGESGLVDVESHTMNHLNMEKCSAKVMERELMMSKNLLQAVLGKRIDFVAWPFGACTPEAVKIAGKLGYMGLVGIDDYLTRKSEIDLSNIGRIEVNGKWDDTKFQRKMGVFKEKRNLGAGLASTKSKSF